MGIAGQGATLGVAISMPPLDFGLYPFCSSRRVRPRGLIRSDTPRICPHSRFVKSILEKGRIRQCRRFWPASRSMRGVFASFSVRWPELDRLTDAQQLLAQWFTNSCFQQTVVFG